MTSKERVLTALSHKPTDRVPFSMGFGVNEPVRAELARRLGLRDAAEAETLLQSKSDLVWVSPPYIGPPDRETTLPDGTRVDIWGVERRSFRYGEGSYEEISRYPLANAEEPEDIAAYRFPELSWFDFDALPGLIREAQKSGPRAVILGNANPFESSWYMRGLENMLADLLTQPELADAILSRVTDFFCGYMQHCLEAAQGGIDIVFTADDIGQQDGLIMSPALWRAHLMPCHRRINTLLHRYGVKIMYHTDGAVMQAVPELIDMGIDVLEALQFDAHGMDPDTLKSLYGDRLCFHGGVSVQSTLPFGTPADVEAEVARRIEVLGKNGGYILSTSHAVQAGTPVDNLLAYFRAAGHPLEP